MRYPLYHSTNVQVFHKIEESGFILANTRHENKKLLIQPYFQVEKDCWGQECNQCLYTQGISLTRHFEFAKNWCQKRNNVIFELDQRELKSRFRARPINFFQSEYRPARDKRVCEFEEFIITKKGIPFNDTFVKNVYAFKDAFTLYDEVINHFISVENIQELVDFNKKNYCNDYVRQFDMYDVGILEFVKGVEALLKHKIIFIN